MIQKSILITKREAEAINKKIQHKRLTQQDSNYLSRYVRPKLREMSQIDSRLLLRQLEYNPKIPAIEKYIKNLILKNVKYVSSITIYGSAIYNNYMDYNDIDVLVAVKKKTWKKLGEKYQMAVKIKKIAEKHRLKLDLQIYVDRPLWESYPINPSLVYQLKDRKTIYGNLKIPSKINIPKLYLRMKLDYSDICDEDSSGIEIYKAIRNTWLVNLIIKKTIDNNKLNEAIIDGLGVNSVKKLKLNRASKTEKNIALLYLNKLLKDSLKTIMNSKWEKIAL